MERYDDDGYEIVLTGEDDELVETLCSVCRRPMFTFPDDPSSVCVECARQEAVRYAAWNAALQTRYNRGD